MGTAFFCVTLTFVQYVEFCRRYVPCFVTDYVKKLSIYLEIVIIL